MPDACRDRKYELLRLDDILLGFAGLRPARHPIHMALADLQPGSQLRPMVRESGLDLMDFRSRPVALLSQAACRRWQNRVAQIIEEIRVLALLRRQRPDEQPPFRCRCERWKVPLVELVCRG